MTMRAIGGVFLGCALLSGMGHLASADIFKCHIAGKVVFQNRPCTSGEGSQPYITHRAPPASPLPLEALPAPEMLPPAPAPGSPTPPVGSMATPAPVRSSPPWEEAPEAKAVDTRQLGLIQPGMTMYEVEKRLGKPESTYERGWTWRWGQFLLQTDWVYPALQSQVPPALIRFVGDQVVSTDRVR